MQNRLLDLPARDVLHNVGLPLRIHRAVPNVPRVGLRLQERHEVESHSALLLLQLTLVHVGVMHLVIAVDHCGSDAAKDHRAGHPLRRSSQVSAAHAARDGVVGGWGLRGGGGGGR